LLFLRGAIIELSDAEKETLGASQKPENRRSLRAPVILLAGEGKATRKIVESLGIRAATVSKWAYNLRLKELMAFATNQDLESPPVTAKEFVEVHNEWSV
jgi:transposase